MRARFSITKNCDRPSQIGMTKRMGYKPRPSRTAFLGLECIF